MVYQRRCGRRLRASSDAQKSTDQSSELDLKIETASVDADCQELHGQRQALYGQKSRLVNRELVGCRQHVSRERKLIIYLYFILH